VDSDLAESISALRNSFERRKVPVQWGKADPSVVDELRSKLRIVRRVREFLLAFNPVDLETATPAERVRLIPAERLLEEQRGFALQEDGQPRPQGQIGPNGWRSTWVIIGHSTLLGDPYFLDTATADAEGDCQVYTAMNGTETWRPRLCASSFAMFLRILAIGMEVAKHFPDRGLDVDDEQVFREALGPKIREYDPAALKAGHWT
jgi:hypothetical protein